jgi:ubiquinone/menaquinone biosynthesis C-methylase UbiE
MAFRTCQSRTMHRLTFLIALFALSVLLPFGCSIHGMRHGESGTNPSPTSTAGHHEEHGTGDHRLHAPQDDDATASHSFADVGRWEAIFDAPGRDRWQRPDEIVAAAGIVPGMRVADLGAGTGYLMPHLSRAVGATGSVLVVEPEPNLVTHLRGRAEESSLDNVTPVLASFSDPRLPRAALDRIVMLDTYHHISDRRSYMADLKGTLRPGGRVVVVDWRKRDLPVGPPPSHKLPRSQVTGEMEAAGYTLVDSRETLPYHYVLVFAPVP